MMSLGKTPASKSQGSSGGATKWGSAQTNIVSSSTSIGWELGIVHTLTKGVLWTDESGFYIGAEVERTCLKKY